MLFGFHSGFFDRSIESSARPADKAWHRGRWLGYQNVEMCSISWHRCSIHTNDISILSGILPRCLLEFLQVTTLIVLCCSTLHFSILCGSWGMFVALMNVLTVP